MTVSVTVKLTAEQFDHIRKHIEFAYSQHKALEIVEQATGNKRKRQDHSILADDCKRILESVLI